MPGDQMGNTNLGVGLLAPAQGLISLACIGRITFLVSLGGRRQGDITF